MQLQPTVFQAAQRFQSASRTQQSTGEPKQYTVPNGKPFFLTGEEQEDCNRDRIAIRASPEVHHGISQKRNGSYWPQ